jgi:hypothetical protein
MSRSRSLAFVAAATLAAATAHGTARQPVPMAPPPRPKPFTAFPDLKPADPDQSFRRVKDILARPVPADAPPHRKVRLAQLYEGTMFLWRFGERLRLAGHLGPHDYALYMDTVSAVFRVAVELEGAPAGKVALAEDRVRLLKEAEEVVRWRVTAGYDPPEQLPDARFRRLDAEADLLKLK